MKLARPSFLASAAALGAVALAGYAWACTPQPAIALSGASGAAGDVVRVRGGGFEARPVELHWNDPAGPTLAVASGPQFQADVQIPAAAPAGYYFVVAVQTRQDGHSAGRAAETLEVAGAGGERQTGGVAPDLWSGFGPAGSGTGIPSTEAAASSWAAGLGAGIAMIAAAVAGLAGTVVAGLRRRDKAARLSGNSFGRPKL